MVDTFVYYVKMPSHINEYVVPCLDGYTIYINESLSDADQINAYAHAMRHIVEKDFEKYDVQGIEMTAHIPRCAECKQ